MTILENVQRAEPLALDTLESLMDAAWLSLERTTSHGWTLRSAGTVTQRANSVWPRWAATPHTAEELTDALTAATTWYTARRQPVIFQLTHREENAALEALLDERRYSRQSETLVMTAPAPAATVEPGNGLRIEIGDVPSEQWLELWWSVDGRGGQAERDIVERIVLGAPALYALALDAQGNVVGTGRLAIPRVDDGNGWGGLYSMAVHPEARRQGIATSILQSLMQAGRESGLENYWLLVTSANKGAQALYSAAGFAEVARYHYRQAPLRRAPGAC